MNTLDNIGSNIATAIHEYNMDKITADDAIEEFGFAISALKKNAERTQSFIAKAEKYIKKVKNGDYII